MAGLLALAPSFIAWWVVFGLGYHRADLADHLPSAPLVVLLVGAAAWVSMLAVASRVEAWRTPAQRLRGAADHSSLAVPLVGAVYLLVAFGILVRLRLAGLGPDSADVPLTGLMLSLGIGTVGMVVLAGLVRTAGRRPLLVEHEGRASLTRWEIAVMVAALAVVVLASLDRGSEPLFQPGGQGLRPMALVPGLVVTVCAVALLRWSGRRSQADQPLPSWILAGLLVLVGLALVMALDPRHPAPAAAAVVGVAVLIAVVTGNRWVPLAVVGLFAGGYFALTALVDSLRGGANVLTDPYQAGPLRNAALALARGGWGGRGPGLGLVESYAVSAGTSSTTGAAASGGAAAMAGAISGPNGQAGAGQGTYVLDGVVPDRYALRVVAEELGLSGVLVVAVVAVAVAVLAVQLARRARRDGVGAWALGLAAATAVTMAMPLVALVLPGFNADIALPGVSPDGASLVALLWAAGALVGAAGRPVRRGEAESFAVARAAAVADGPAAGGPARLARVAGSAVPGRLVAPLVAFGCVLLLLIALPLARVAANHHRAGADTAAIADANAQRPMTSLDWGPGGVDSDTKAAVDAQAGSRLSRQCPADLFTEAPGGGFGLRCPAEPKVTLSASAQLAALTGLAAGAGASVVALDLGDGKLLALAAGGRGTGAGGSPTSTPATEPSTPSAEPSTPSTPSSEPSTPSLSPSSAVPSPGAPPAGQPADRGGPTTASSGPIALNGRGADGSGPAGGTQAADTTFQAGSGADVGNGRADQAGWWTAAPTGSLGQALILSALRASPKYEEAAKAVLPRMREDALKQLVEAGDVEQKDADLVRNPPKDPKGKEKNALDRTRGKVDKEIRKTLALCVYLPDEDDPIPDFRAGKGCETYVSQLVDAFKAKGPLDEVLLPLQTAFGLIGGPGAVLRSEGLTPDQKAGFDGLDTGSCGTDGSNVDDCLQASPLQVAVALGGLYELRAGKDGLLAVPHLLAGDATAKEDRPAVTRLTALENLGTLVSGDSIEVLAGDGAWSVRFVDKGRGHGPVVIVGYVPSAAGGPTAAATAAHALTGPVADALGD